MKVKPEITLTPEDTRRKRRVHRSKSVKVLAKILEDAKRDSRSYVSRWVVHRGAE